MRRRGSRLSKKASIPFGIANLIDQQTRTFTGSGNYSGVAISNDKTILYVSSQGFKHFNLNIVNPDDVNSWTLRSMSSYNSDMRGIGVNHSGTFIYRTGGAGIIEQRSLSTAHDLSTQSIVGTFNTGLGGTFSGLSLSNNEMKAFATFYFASNPSVVLELNLMSPGNIVGATIVQTYTIAALQRGISFSKNGYYFFTSLNTDGYVHEVTTPFTLNNPVATKITGTFNSVGQPGIDSNNNRIYTAVWPSSLRVHAASV